MFDKIKDFMKMKKQMQELKKRLDDMVIKTQSPKKIFEITVNGTNEVKDVKVIGDINSVSKDDIQKDLKVMLNMASNEVKVLATKAMAFAQNTDTPSTNIDGNNNDTAQS